MPPIDTVDLVYSILAVHHLSEEEKQALFKKVHTQLKSGGLFILIDVVLGSDARLTEIYVEKTFGFDDVDKPSTLMEQLEWLKQAGFTMVDVAWKNYKLACIIAAKQN